MEDARELIRQLSGLTHKKYEFLHEIQETAKRQQLLTDSNSFNSLMDSIQKRQQLMEEIDFLDRQFYLIYVQLKEKIGVSALDQIEAFEYPEILELRELISSLMNLLGEIDELDHSNLTGLKREIETVKENMRKAQSQKRVSRGYGMRSPSGYGTDAQGFYIDGKK